MPEFTKASALQSQNQQAAGSSEHGERGVQDPQARRTGRTGNGEHG
jgi:hypothetical protein